MTEETFRPPGGQSRLRPPAKEKNDQENVPCAHVYDTRRYPVGHFGCSLVLWATRARFDAGKHALEAAAPPFQYNTFCLFNRSSHSIDYYLMPITNSYCRLEDNKAPKMNIKCQFHAAALLKCIGITL